MRTCKCLSHLPCLYSAEELLSTAWQVLICCSQTIISFVVLACALLCTCIPLMLKTARSNAGTLRSFTTRVAHVLPVSDDGGSTAEIVRVLGGPAVGDIRSRCLRLADDSNTEVSTALYSQCTFTLRELFYALHAPLLSEQHQPHTSPHSLTHYQASLSSFPLAAD